MGLPILARPVGLTARLWMWCQRNRALAALAALLMLAFLGGIAGVAWKWREADHERVKTEAVNELLTRRLLSWAGAELDPQSKDLTVRELVDRASAQLGGWLDGQPDVEARIRETIGGVYLSLGRNDQAAVHVETAVRLDTELYGTRHRDTIRATNLLTLLLDRTGQGALAEDSRTTQPGNGRGALGADDPITLESAERLGTILWHLGKTDEAEALLRKNVDDRRRVLKPEHPDTLRSVYLLSRVLRERKSYLRCRTVCLRLCAQHPVLARLQPSRLCRRTHQPGGRLPRQGRSRPGRAALRSGGSGRPPAVRCPSPHHPRCGENHASVRELSSTAGSMSSKLRHSRSGDAPPAQ